MAHTNLAPSAVTASSGNMGNLLTVTSSGASAWMPLGSRTGVRGFYGTVTTLGSVTFQAEEYLFRTTSTDPAFFLMVSTGAFNINPQTSGPAAGGRDQAAVLATSPVHWYAISTGSKSTSIAGVVSTNLPSPTGGPTLPTSYNAWCYLGGSPYSTVSSAAAYPQRPRGSWFFFETGQRLLTGGRSTAQTAIDLTTFVPSNALKVCGPMELDSTSAATVTMHLNPVSGSNYIELGLSAAASTGGNTQINSLFWEMPQLSQTLFYNVTSSGGAAFVSIAGYQVPNGGE